MDIHKLAAWAQVLSFPTGAYRAYGTYVTIHPTTGSNLPVIFNPVALYISFGAFGACLLLVAIVAVIENVRSRTSRLERRQEKSLPAQDWRFTAQQFQIELERVSKERDAHMRQAMDWKLMADEANEDLKQAAEEHKRLAEVAVSEYNRGFSEGTKLTMVRDPTLGIDDKTVQLYRGAFPQTWEQRMALKWIWDHSRYDLSNLRSACSTFRDWNERLVAPVLANRVLVEHDDTHVWIKTPDARLVLEKLFKENPLC